MKNVQLLKPQSLREVYAAERCYYFALALGNLTGFPILEVGVATPQGVRAGHAVVALPNGDVADANGVSSRDAMLTEWRSDTFVEADPEQIMDDLCASEDGDGLLTRRSVESDVYDIMFHIQRDGGFLENIMNQPKSENPVP